MFDTILFTALSIPACFSIAMFVITIVGAGISVLYYIFRDSEAMMQIVFKFTQADTPPFNAISVSGFVLCCAMLLHIFDFIKIETFYMVYGMYSVVSLWYMIYVIDVLYSWYRELRLKKKCRE